MHQIKQLVLDIDKTHKGLGKMIASNILAAKAKKTILNVSPAGCGKSVASHSAALVLKDKAREFTSITLAGLVRMKDELKNYQGHIIIDDLGAERSIWSRVSTVTALSHLVYTHFVDKVTQGYEIKLENFYGSVSLNAQPVLMNSLVQADDWISLVRDKVWRYYHLARPIHPQMGSPKVNIGWGTEFDKVEPPTYKGTMWYQLIAVGLTQWSMSRCNEHIPDLLRACAALDGRTKVIADDYRVLRRILIPMQLERYVVSTYGFEEGRVFDNNLYCILVELSSFNQPTLMQICEDYKVSPDVARRLIDNQKQWCSIENHSTPIIKATPKAQEILDLCGAGKTW